MRCPAAKYRSEYLEVPATVVFIEKIPWQVSTRWDSFTSEIRIKLTFTDQLL